METAVHTEPAPAPIMDVAPPKTPPASLSKSPPAESGKSDTPRPASSQQPSAYNVPTVAIFVAVTLFIILSALAYYAYSKTT